MLIGTNLTSLPRHLVHRATGGGAHKFADVWEKDLGIRIDKQDELDSLVAGMQFVLSTVIGECYTFRPKCDAPERQVSSSTSNSFTKPQTEECDRSDVGLSLNESMDSSEGQGGIEVNGTVDGSMPSISTKTNVDEWWWSRKVQRDTISYSSSYPYLLVTIGTGVSFCVWMAPESTSVSPVPQLVAGRIGASCVF